MIRSFTIALGLAAASLGVQANTITVNGVLDASTVTREFVGGDFYQGAPFTLQTGDVVRLNLSFLPGQALQLKRPDEIGLRVRGEQANILPQLSVTAMFTGLTGPAHDVPTGSTFTLASSGDLNVVVGGLRFMNTFDAGGFPLGTISFTGVSIEVTVMNDNTLAGHDFYGIDFQSYALESAQAISVVPEPTEALLLSLGLVALTGAVRRRCAS